MIGAIASHYVAATASGYAGEVLADSPLAYYRLGETSGTVMVDSSGNSRHGQYFSAVTLGATGLVAGDTDKCVDLNGSICYNPYASWMTAPNFTIEAIFVADQVDGNRTIASRYDSAGPVWTLRVDNGVLTMWVYTSTFFPTTATTAIVAGTKYHVAATYDGTNVNLHVNGTLERTVSAPGLATSTAGFRIGTGSAGEYYDGRIDEVAFYGTALSGTRVAAHAALV